MPELWIPRDAAGTRATLQIMRGLADDGAVRAIRLSVRDLDLDLRARWDFQGSFRTQVLRTVATMVDEFGARSRFSGSCADAAVLAASIWIGRRRVGLPAPAQADFCAVRFPDNPHFGHVFVLAGYGEIRVDPTAPVNADYSNCETMVERFI